MKEVNKTKHIPVLFDEVIKGLSLVPGKIVVDATLGGGGHARAFLQEVLSNGTVIAIDTDLQAIERFTKGADAVVREAIENGRCKIFHGNYSALKEIVTRAGEEKVDAIFADLGFSSDQIEDAGRGLSFQLDGPLDMRLDQSSFLTAARIVNTYTQSEIEKILREFGDEPQARRIAQAIGKRRKEKEFSTTSELRELILDIYPKKLRYAQKIHPATKTFQALRIAVNSELDHLKQFLEASVELLRTKGRLAVITLHSGEDRVVKKFFKEQAQGCICPPDFPVCRCGRISIVRLISKKPVTAGTAEESKNPRARSAKLRIVEKI